MRIIAGNLKGREFKAPSGRKTHPMSEKARGAIFNVLGDIEGLSFLDAYAGSGALSLEAISRGAKNALALEYDKQAYKIASLNVIDLGLEARIKVLRANNKQWSKGNAQVQFDIVLLDPPYDDFQRDVLQRLAMHAKNGGLVVLSWPGKEPAPALEGLTLIKQKVYGDAQLVFYRK